MRPLIVLLLVVAAVVTYFVAFDGQEAPKNSGADLGPSTPAVADPDQPGETPVELERPDEDRTEVAATTVEPTVGRTSPAASQSNELTGVVLTPDGQPVEGAEVVLTRFGRNNLFFVEPGGIDRSSDRKTKTTSKGRYSFTGVTPMKDYSLKVSHGDYAPQEVGNVQVGEAGVFEEPPVYLNEGISVSGFVRDATGNGVGGAHVYLTTNPFGGLSEQDADTQHARTDDAGRYEFRNVGINTYTLAVVADGFGRVNVPQVAVTGEVSVTKDVTLETAEMIGGRVMTDGAEPLEGVQVQVFSLNQRNNQTRSSVESGENGEFVFEDIPEGSYTLLVNVPGYEHFRKQRVESGEMGVLVELVPLPTVSGSVRDAADQQPLRRFTVRLRQEVPNSPVALPVQDTKVAVDDETGAFTVPVPKPGNYVVEAVADGYAMCFSPDFTVNAGQDVTGIVVSMTRGGQISGTVVDAAGSPVRNARVTSRDKDWHDDEFTAALGDMLPTLAVERTVRTDAEGRFLLEGLTPAEYKLEISHPRHPQELKTGIHVAEGKTADAGRIQLRQGASVAGIVRDPNGDTVVGAVIQMQTAQGSMSLSPRTYSAKTDSDGRYRIENVAAGSYSVTVRRTAQAGTNPFQDWQDAKSSQKPVTVSEGQSLDGFDLTLGDSGN